MSKDFKIKLGNRIKYLREKNNLSLKEAAEKSRISKSNLIIIEKGLVNAGLVTLAKVSRGLNVKLHELFDL